MAVHELRLEPRISEIARLIEWVEARCGAAGVSDDLAFKMTLALEEAVVNIIGNAFLGAPPPHRIRLRLEITAELVRAEVVDSGRPFDPTAVPPPDLARPAAEREPGGLGIHLMRSVMDRLQYRRRGGANVLRLEKARR
jgi:serine/threonine-protein kinase RsbW